MAYLVFARKYRPLRFSELIGQEHIVKAVANSIASGKIHHAFLFSETRGVGKTTAA
ncbi:MAG: DNA polymerase III subunit gamma/tau, partial [Fibrobacterota bacterium]